MMIPMNASIMTFYQLLQAYIESYCHVCENAIATSRTGFFFIYRL